MFARKDLKLLNEINGMFWQSLSWLDETLYARVRRPFRCCDRLSEFLGGFSNEENSE